MITQEELLSLFTYSDGMLYRKDGRAVSGKPYPNGYYYMYIGSRRHLLHRVIYAWHTGEWPPLVDHKDTDTNNNRIDNLRPLTKSLNTHNSDISRGKIESRGVCWDNNRGRYLAQIRVDGKNINLGRFDSEVEASYVYLEAKKKFFPSLF